MVEKQHGSFDLLQKLLNWTLVLKKPKCLLLSRFDLQNWGVQNVAQRLISTVTLLSEHTCK